MEELTLIPDVDKVTLLNLNDELLFNLASKNPYVNSLMNEEFWTSKFQKRYNVTLCKYEVSHESVYREFSRLSGYNLAMRTIERGFIELIDLSGKYNKDNLLIYAAKRGRIQVVKLLLDNISVDLYNNVVVFATQYGHLELVDFLLGKGTTNLDYLFKIAIDNHNLSMVVLLLDKGADIHTQNDYALKVAAFGGDFILVKLLLDRGANIHVNNDYALRWGCQNNNLMVVKLLLDRGANIHVDNNSPLQWAAKEGNFEVVKLLLSRGADIHALENAALRFAAEKGHFEVVKLLVNKGADIHAKDDYALKWASVNGYLDVIKLLLERGARADKYTNILMDKL